MKNGMFLLIVSSHLLITSVAHSFEAVVAVPSRTLSDGEFLPGDASNAAPVLLSGTLNIPDSDTPVAAAVLLHGTDGPGSGSVWNWSRYLYSIGVASLELDSYTARGLEEASTEQSKFPQFTQIYDAYRAVEVLAANPKIDPARIVVMGFSRGGNAALFSAMNRFQQSFGPTRGRIAAHLPFYPACNFQLHEQDNVTDAPIRLFHGADDDWTPAPACRDYVDRLVAAGHDAEMTIFPNALHAFDNPRAPARRADAEWQTSRNCMRREEDGQLLNAATGKPFSYSDACVEFGPSSQYNDAATSAAQLKVKQLFAELPVGR